MEKKKVFEILFIIFIILFALCVIAAFRFMILGADFMGGCFNSGAYNIKESPEVSCIEVKDSNCQAGFQIINNCDSSLIVDIPKTPANLPNKTKISSLDYLKLFRLYPNNRIVDNTLIIEPHTTLNLAGLLMDITYHDQNFPVEKPWNISLTLDNQPILITGKINIEPKEFNIRLSKILFLVSLVLLILSIIFYIFMLKAKKKV